MVDIPKFVRLNNKKHALKRIEEVRIALATNSRASDEEEYKTLIQSLTKTADIRAENRFDREKFEQLRSFRGGR
ncbi:hypothetical protein [Bacillus subtilis]|uniref:hypothetical protein n=1 Tax=Bacillus subtilis TaxID=1423 RepID=UPI003980CF2D